MSDTKISDFEQIIERAVSRLVSVRHENSGSFVTTPSMYPSGGAVVIWIDRAHPRYFVSDYSFGARECEIMGADKRQFRKHAEPIAEQYGLTLSNDGALEALVSEGQIEGAIKAVANASQEIALSYAKWKANLTENQRQIFEHFDYQFVRW